MIRVLILCVFVTFQTTPVKSNRISPKLDFGQDDHPVFNIKSPGITSANIKDETTVICSGSGCNKTISENSDKDIVNDVVVHVKTSVNIPKTKNETIEDTPDIPVVLGYGNSQYAPEDHNLMVTNYIGKHQVPHRNKQYVWPSEGGAVGFNPVEFKRFEKPPVWSRPVASFSSQFPARSNGYYTTCTCRNPGLNWYPTTSTWNINGRGNLNTGIDDKLAPLN
ncbi:hypothetical protein QE152_g423 [Popillia japonica]|uniref:Uncharacterized protein n=1 Tax=Popillia japonica TaxID=7064 RepID=A0AAW1N9S4_POPJA